MPELELTDEERKRGWTEKTLAEYLAERTRAQAGVIRCRLRPWACSGLGDRGRAGVPASAWPFACRCAAYSMLMS